jgi:small subunit ribosomal protein S11
MSRSLTSRLVAQSIPKCSGYTVSKTFAPFTRSFSGTTTRWDDNKTSKTGKQSLLESIYGSPQNKQSLTGAMAGLSSSMSIPSADGSRLDTSILSNPNSTQQSAEQLPDDHFEPYHLHVFAHKHNTHITVTKPNRDAIISMSCGNIGFKKSRRGGFDASYSLTKYVLERLVYTGWPPKIRRLEVVLRGFGPGRDAATKVLMSPEGKILRDKIVRVSDSTRIKFGGTRSPKRRRL